MKRSLIFLFLLIHSFIMNAAEPRDLLQHQATAVQLQSYIQSPASWVRYPAYNDRAGWDAFTGSLKAALIKDGEKYLTYSWQVVKATDYLEYERTGSRAAMENPYGNNNKALGNLIFAELAEGKGRFIDQIINGTWQACELSSWSLSAHLPYQKTKRDLPDFHETIIDLGSGDMGSFFAWTWYFLHQEFDKVNPIISQRLAKEIRDRIIDPYMQRSDYWWQALSGKPDVLVNNWNPWVNSNVMTCFLLMETDPVKRTAGVYKTMQSTDQFINYVKADGACEEGPSYWGHAAGKLYDYLQVLYSATAGKVDLFGDPMIRRMGEYISRSYVGNDWVVNFADASAKGGGDIALIHRYGQAVKSEEMMSFAAYLLNKNNGKMDVNVARDFFRSIENIRTYLDVQNGKPALPSFGSAWYPETQFLYLRFGGGMYFAGKAGFNNESHNHNDVGTFNLYVDTLPMIIDAGVGTYTRQTFGSERYSIWTMQSDYHNVPKVNGVPQSFGGEFKATDVRFDDKKDQFILDLAGAYPADAAVKEWHRMYNFSSSDLVIREDFKLNAMKAPNELHYLVWAKPDLSKPGTVGLSKEGRTLQLQYDPKQFDATFDVIRLDDKRLSNVWGPEVYRVVLKAKEMKLKGTYIIKIKR